MNDCPLFESLVLPEVPRPRGAISSWRSANHVARCASCRERAERLRKGLSDLDLGRDVEALGALSPELALARATPVPEPLPAPAAESRRSVFGRLVNGHAVPVAGLALALVIAVATVSWVAGSGQFVPLDLEALLNAGPRHVPKAIFLPILGPVVFLLLMAPGILSRIACGREGCFV